MFRANHKKGNGSGLFCKRHNNYRIEYVCKFYKTKFVEAGSKAELGKFTGADSRAVVSVNDDNFAKAILDRLND